MGVEEPRKGGSGAGCDGASNRHRHAGVLDEPLALARRVGADVPINVGRGAEPLAQEIQRAAGFEVAFDVSRNPAGLATCLEAERPSAMVVQVGALPPGKFRSGDDFMPPVSSCGQSWLP
jgi:threonine dehydrogenase-like Zn-dependent dehydrogenase